jgi:hypothetical protein
MHILNLRFEFTNPFDRWDYFKNLGCLHGDMGMHKAWELEHSYYSPLLFDCELSLTHKQDHPGFEIGIGILGYGIHFRIYDTRHWDYEKECYEEYNFDKYFDLEFYDKP